MQKPELTIRVGRLSDPPTHFWVRLWVNDEFHSGATVRKEEVGEKAGRLFMQWALQEKQVWRCTFPAMLTDFHLLPESVHKMKFRISLEEELPEPEEVKLFDAYIFINTSDPRINFMGHANALMNPIPISTDIPVPKQSPADLEKQFRRNWALQNKEYRLGDSKTHVFKDNITIVIPVYGLESLKDQ